MKPEHSFIPEWLKRLLTTPTEELSRWQYAARFFLELCRQGARQLREDRASEIAASLSYRTIFGLVPVVIIAALFFRAFGGADVFEDLVSRLLVSAKLDQVSSPDKTQTLAEWARGMVKHIDTGVQGRAIGTIGALVLAWAVIGLLTTIERSFNLICRAQHHRSLARRIPLYWTAITIGPALLYVSFHFESRFMGLFERMSWGHSLASMVGALTSFVSVWLLLMGLYTFMPYARVSLKATAAGSFVATVLWRIATNAFRWYVAHSFSSQSSAFTILYGSLGLIPLFMLWVYFLWLVVLYGLEISVMLHVVGGRMGKGMPARPELPRLTDPACVIPLMQVVASRFDRGQVTTTEEIVTEARLNPQAVGLMLDALQEAGFLHAVEGRGEGGYALARPPGRVTTAELLQVAQRLTDVPMAEETAGGAWLASFRQAELSLPVHRALADL